MELERTHGQEKVIIHAADLYLLEEWNDDPAISDEAQRSAIFSKWLELGWRGRMPYLEKLKDMSDDDDDITDDEKDLLARVRNPSDRREISYTCLVRTFYGDNSDKVFADLLAEAEYDEPIFNNAALYDAGSDNGLKSVHNILTRIPQIIRENEYYSLMYDDDIRKAEIGFDEDEYPIDTLHKAVKWGHVLIYDKEANDKQGDVLLVYIDYRGRILRYSRLNDAEGLWASDGMLHSGQDVMREWWEEGLYGEDWEPEQIPKRRSEIRHELSM